MYKRNQRRTDILDTSDWAHRKLVERLRQLTPEQRLKMTLESIQFGMKLEALAKTEEVARPRLISTSRGY
jgi:hypothetical protein